MAKDRNGRRYWVGDLRHLQDIAGGLEPLSPHFVLLLAVDADSLDDGEIRRVSRILIDRGAVSLCAWGRDCERTHDLFDRERDPIEPDGGVIMTTWHTRDSLSKVVWFFVYCAHPDSDYEADCTDWVAISIGHSEWARKMEKSIVKMAS